MAERRAAGPLATVVASRSLRRVVTAYLGFGLVESATWIGILVYAHEVTGPASVGPVALAQLLPAALFAPLAARLGDRHPRLHVLLAGHGLIAATSLVVAGAMALDSPWPVVYAAAIVAAAVVTIPRPLQGAIVPSFADTPEELTAANGVSTLAEGVGVLLGPLVAALLLATGSPATVFFAGGVIAGGAALLVATLGRDLARPATARGAAPTDELRPPAVERPPLRARLRALRATGPTLVTAMLAARFVVVGALDVLVVLLAAEGLGLGGEGAGFLAAALGLGVIAGGATTLMIAGRRGLPGRIAAGGLACGVALAVIAAEPGALAVLALLVAVGGGLAWVDVAGRTLLQRMAPPEALAGMFGLVEGLAMLGLAVGSAAAGLAYAVFGLPAAMVLTAILLPSLALAAWARLRHAETALDVPTEQVALLRGLRLFAAMPAPALERTARALTPFVLPAGAILFREGELGDRFYVVEAGDVEVRQGGRVLRQLGAGEGFGEIALLRDIPRTATVIATTDARLCALARADFLLAITGSPEAVAEAEARTELLLAGDQLRA